MTDIAKHAKLTHAGALKMIEAGIAKALEINVPQCITVTDDGGRLLAAISVLSLYFNGVATWWNIPEYQQN